jgi:hypothetical protein
LRERFAVGGRAGRGWTVGRTDRRADATIFACGLQEKNSNAN